MVRGLLLIVMAILVALSGLVFELQNIWPFNQGRVFQLRMVFLVFALGSTLPVVSARLWWLAPTLLATAFTITTLFSYARITPAYLLTCAFLVFLVAVVSRATWRHAKVR